MLPVVQIHNTPATVQIEGRYSVLLEDLEYSIFGKGCKVPKGTLTDGPSVPLWIPAWLLDPAQIERAGFIHDDMRTKFEARGVALTDAAFYFFCVECGLSRWKAVIAALAVYGAAKAPPPFRYKGSVKRFTLNKARIECDRRGVDLIIPSDLRIIK